MSKILLGRLSRRERQIMEILFARGEATVTEVQAAIPNAPSYSTVRALLRILEEKGQATHREDGARYVYAPAESWAAASRSALEQVVQTFFAGSLESAVSTLLSSRQSRPSDDELFRLERLIQKARSVEIAEQGCLSPTGECAEQGCLSPTGECSTEGEVK